MKYLTLLIVIAVAVLALWLMAGVRAPKQSALALQSFAQCLTDKGFTMYGAYWCPHCQNEKALFGEAFDRVQYVECTKEPARCTAAGIEGFPTWVTDDGRRFQGEQGLERLSEASGCRITE